MDSMVFELKGLEEFQKRLLALEPEIINAQVEAIKSVAPTAIAMIRSSLPSTYKALRDSVMARIRSGGKYKNKIFFTIGVGGENAKNWSSAPQNDPVRFARWHEHGFEPKKWEKRSIKKFGRSTISPDFMNKYGNVNPTKALHFMKKNKAAIRELILGAVTEATLNAVKTLESSGHSVDLLTGGDILKMAQKASQDYAVVDERIS